MVSGTVADAVPDAGVADHAGESLAVSRKKIRTFSGKRHYVLWCPRAILLTLLVTMGKSGL